MSAHLSSRFSFQREATFQKLSGFPWFLFLPRFTRLWAARSRPSRSRKSLHRALPITVPPFGEEVGVRSPGDKAKFGLNRLGFPHPNITTWLPRKFPDILKSHWPLHVCVCVCVFRFKALFFMKRVNTIHMSFKLQNHEH